MLHTVTKQLTSGIGAIPLIVPLRDLQVSTGSAWSSIWLRMQYSNQHLWICTSQTDFPKREPLFQCTHGQCTIIFNKPYRTKHKRTIIVTAGQYGRENLCQLDGCYCTDTRRNRIISDGTNVLQWPNDDRKM